MRISTTIGLSVLFGVTMLFAGCGEKAPGSEEAPVAAEQEPPAVKEEQPAAVKEERPAAVKEEQPAVVKEEQPAAAMEEKPAATEEETPVAGLALSYPLDGTLFPPESAPPTFRWEDGSSGVLSWRIIAGFDDGAANLEFVSEKSEWTPAPADWDRMKKRSLEKECRVTIQGLESPTSTTVVSAASVRISTSSDEVGASIFYRDVILPFIDAIEDPSEIRWRFGSVSSLEQPPVVLENLPVCGNCHSFSADGKTLGMDVDYANDKGSYVVVPVGREMELNSDSVISWSDYKRDDGKTTFGLLSQVSPDGRYVVSTVKDRSVFVPRPDLAFSQLFFPIQGILVVYDLETGEFNALPGADDPSLVQSNPTWSPDGKTIIFARAKAAVIPNLKDEKAVLLAREEAKEYLDGSRKFLFDLYTIPFNDGKGGTPQPLSGASDNGMSNFFPRYSPDGKWVVFCKARSYMLLQPDSELYIMPAEGGEARRMECNTSKMNSWHSWSPNSKWLVFSSKENGPYTQLFLTHIDSEGRSTPPVVLDRFTTADRAANIPEFVPLPPDAIQVMRENFLDDTSYVRAASESAMADDMEAAKKHLRMALKINPKNVEAHKDLGVALSKGGDSDSAIEHFEEAIRLAPADSEAHVNLGMERMGQGDTAGGMTLFEKAVALDSESALARSKLGTALLESGRIDEALEQFGEAVRLSPIDPGHNSNYAFALARNERYEEAITYFEKALRLDPKMAEVHHNLGLCFARLNRLEEAVPHFKEAVELNSSDPDYHNNLGMALVHSGKLEEAVTHFQKALVLKPDFDAARSNLELAEATALQGAADLKTFEEVAADNPNSGEAHFALAQAKAQGGDLEGALIHFGTAAKLAPDNALLQLEYGMALAKANDHDGAVEQLERAVALNPNNPLPRDALARSLSLVGKLDEALPHFQEALRLSGGHPFVLNDLGEALARVGRLEEARVQFEAAVQAGPDFLAARKNLEKVVEALEKKQSPAP